MKVDDVLRYGTILTDDDFCDDMDDSGTCFYHCSICGSTNTIKGPLGAIKI